jgi:hypothetical protein
MRLSEAEQRRDLGSIERRAGLGKMVIFEGCTGWNGSGFGLGLARWKNEEGGWW